MLPPEVEARVAAIASDLESGASELSLRALEAFEALPPDARRPSVFRELAAKLAVAQPSMASVRNVASLCEHLLSAGGDPGIALHEVRRGIEGARQKIARNALKLFGSRVSLITLSRSSAVLAVCVLLHDRGRLVGVQVLESRPRLEGRRTAKELAALGIPTTLVADAFGPSVVRSCDAVVTGADSVLRDGALVNKIGSYPLALAAREAGKPFYVACEVIKMDPANTMDTLPAPPVRPPEGLGPPSGVNASNAYFDRTPGDLVTAYVTDKGVYEPTRVAELLLR